jgi:hypothetical protein
MNSEPPNAEAAKVTQKAQKTHFNFLNFLRPPRNLCALCVRLFTASPPNNLESP